MFKNTILATDENQMHTDVRPVFSRRRLFIYLCVSDLYLWLKILICAFVIQFVFLKELAESNGFDVQY
jgi:hypothetical protein